MSAKSGLLSGGLLVVGAASVLLIVSPALSQEPEPNHLDCWFNAAANAVECPSHPVQEGRGSRSDPARVDRAFDLLDPPPQTGPSGFQPRDLQAPDLHPLPAPRPARAVRTRTMRAEARNPGCRNYRTYNPATGTYRGYDGVVRRCRVAR